MTRLRIVLWLIIIVAAFYLAYGVFTSLTTFGVACAVLGLAAVCHGLITHLEDARIRETREQVWARRDTTAACGCDLPSPLAAWEIELHNSWHRRPGE